MPRCRQRQITELLLAVAADVVGVAPVLNEGIEPLDEAAAAAELAYRRLEYETNERSIGKGLRGNRLFDRQPSVPSVAGGIDPEPGKKPPQRPVQALLDLLSMERHCRW